MTLLKDLIEIPEHVGKGDFVFTLENAVDHPDEVLRDYVVTEQLQGAFDEALSLIESALTSRESRATYLHGSFGSGKSHFMAVLYLLLAHVAEARAVPELQKPLDAHDDVLEGKRFLLVPVHMINSGADTLEKAIFTAYVERVRALHPDAPTPAVFASGPLIQDAMGLRERMGDEAFFAGLNAAGQGTPSGLGKLAATTWTPETFDSAIDADPGSPQHDSVVAALIEVFFGAYSEVAGEDKFVDFEDGLATMSRHAQGLEYDGLILFLDELILWLATRIADMTFVQKEGQKLTTLREAPLESRPIPIVSFVARQRDLRELIGEHYPGAERLGFHDALAYSEGRFSTITLEDRNLRAIAERRVLRPKSEAAKAEIDSAFDKTLKSGEKVIDVLLGKGSTAEEFRAVYPFSPAFVDTLVAASSALQRERTAIRVMIQLLSEGRHELELGDLIPVGELFDVLSGADEPFSQELKRQFKEAQVLYSNRLRPQIAATAGLGPDDPLAGAAAAEDLLIKTLLLAALIPDAEPLRGLTASRLVALNHGTIATPIPGQETSTALAALRRLRGSVGQLKIQEGVADPTVQIELSGIDTDRIIDSASGELDNNAARKRLVRDFVREALGLSSQEGLFDRYRLEWRGIEREVEVALENVRELSGERAVATGGEWKLLVDFPFDTDGSQRRDDEARIEVLRGEVESSQTVFWLPAFFTNAVQRDLGVLVTLDGLLVSSDRLASHTAHLPAAEREKARQLLESQRSQLRSTVKAALDQAYGVATAKPETIDGAEKASFDSLEATLDLRPPIGSDLGAAVTSLCDQLLRHQYPGHPEFGERVTSGKIGKVWALIQSAAERPDGRLDDLERADRLLLKNIAQPLELGEMHEGPFVLGTTWRDRFVKAGAAARVESPTVSDLRGWINQDGDRGLTNELESLIVLTYAAQQNLSFEMHGGPFAPQGPRDVDDSLVLREVELPTQEDWDVAAERAAALFGIAVPRLPSAHNLDRYGAEIRARAQELQPATAGLVVGVKNTLGPALGLGSDSDRLASSEEADALVNEVSSGDDADSLRALASLDLDATPEAIGRTLGHAATAARSITGANWDLIGGAVELADQGDDRATAAIEELRSAARNSEMVAPLSAALQAAEAAATAVLVKKPKPKPQGTVHTNLTVIDAREVLDAVPDPDAVEIDLTIRDREESERP